MPIQRVILFAVLALPAAARAQDAAPGEVHGTVHQTLVALLNPMGAEHTLEAGVRARLGDPHELLFTGTHAEAGAVNYLSPVYSISGGYLQISPLAFLVLRAEFSHTVVWPIGMEAAGYYRLTSYDDVRPQALTAEAGDSATGWNVTVSGRLQGMVPIGPVTLIALDQLTGEHTSLGDAPYYYSMKHDLVMAREDWVLLNDAMLMGQIDFTPTIHFAFGAYDNLRYVPGAGIIGAHQVGPIVLLTAERVDRYVPEIAAFVRGGYYTHHALRADEVTILGGVSITYDFGAIR